MTAALPVLFSALLLTGCGQTAAPAADATAAASAEPSTAQFVDTPTAAPAASPSPSVTSLKYPASAAKPMDEFELNDPMLEYQETLVTPEEKAIRDRIYEAFPEIINQASPNNTSPQDFSAKLHDRGLITSSFVDHMPPYFGALNEAMRKAELSRRVQSLYCPMHIQTSTALEMGWTTCSYTAQIVNSTGGPIPYQNFISIVGKENGSYYLGQKDMLQQRVDLVQEDGVWKIAANF
jgi:hypothetical protein